MDINPDNLTPQEINLLKSLLAKAENSIQEVNIESNTEVVDEVVVQPVHKQTRNKPSNLYYTYKGETKSLTEWCKELNLQYTRVHKRITRGWSVEKAFEEGVKVYEKKPRTKEHLELECPICHEKFTQVNSRQKTCSNEHCRAIANAKQIRDRLYKIRMAELGQQVDELVE